MNLSYQEQQDQKRIDDKKKSMPWREYWHLYLSLIGTGILTAFAGIYLGLAPSATGEIVFLSGWDMVRRIFFALYYAGMFLLVAEGATLFAKDKLLQRDVEVVNNKTVDIPAQRRSMTAMLWVSVVAIVMTTVAAGYILASWLHALNEFVTIPTAAQTWVVIGPPALLVFDAVMALIYQQNSKKYELNRWIEQQKRMAEANAQTIWGNTYVEAYGREAPEAARRAARTQAMTDARIWAGSGVDHQDASHDQSAMTPRHDPQAKMPVMEQTKKLELYADSESGMMLPAVMETPDTHDPARDNHGIHPEPVMEENTMTNEEAGADPDSPM